ncbi:MAG TPA: LPS export ABC transporter periplasmic protein LptC [Marinagarivorans sp.]
MKNWFYISLISVITMGVVLLWDTRPELLNPLSKTESPFERFPYAVLHDAQTSHFNEDGELSYEFDAVTLKHFRADTQNTSDQDYMLITAPKLTLYGEPEPWFVTAKQGKVMAHGEKLILWDDVEVWQTRSGDIDATTKLSTQSIDIYPNLKRIITDAHVHIEGPNGTINADGLEVDMVTQRIKLLANVRGQHEPIQ